MNDDRPTGTPAPTYDGDDLLLKFVRERDALCPLCGYNVRNLTQTRCPECDRRLELRVGIADIRIGWYLATVAPCIFSGIAALFFTAIVIVATVTEGAGPWFFYFTAVFGWVSGIGGVILLVGRLRFLALPIATQRMWAILMWAIHIITFLFVVGLTMDAVI